MKLFLKYNLSLYLFLVKIYSYFPTILLHMNTSKIWNSVHDFRGVDDSSSPLKPLYTRVPRFEPGSIESKQYLQEYGYVVIKNVLSKQESNTAINLIWDYLEELNTGINRNDYRTID